jgi:hypothetical protein
MFYHPAHVLLIAVAMALVLPEPGRFNPFALARPAARALARDLPRSGRWAAPAGTLLLAVIAAPALAVIWALTYGLPMAVQVAAPGASPTLALVIAAIALKLALWFPPAWAPPMRVRAKPAAVVPYPSMAWLAAEMVAPILLFAFLGLYSVVAYRVALEITRALPAAPQADALAAPSAWLAYVPAAPAQRVVLLLMAIAGRPRPATIPPPQAELQPSGAQATIALAGTIALALLVTIW